VAAAFVHLEPLARLVVASLFNGLWQGALIAGTVWAIMRCFPRVNASTRYAAWSAALLAVLIVPVVTTLPRVTSEQSAAQTTTAGGTALARAVTNVPLRHGSELPRTVRQPANVRGSVAISPAPHVAVPGAPTVAIFSLWALIALAIVVRLIVALVQLERLKRDALPLRVEYRDAMKRWPSVTKGMRDVRLCVSNAIEVPIAVGLFDAMILLPQHLLDRLDSQEIDQISLHELAHLRRADDWTNGLQRIAQALLFFNPAVLFIAHQMDLEREVACDDWVLALTGAARPYAFCLTKMAEVTAWPHRALGAPGVFATRKNISIRIERLLAAKRAIGSALAPGASVATVAALLAAFFVLRMVTPSIAYTGDSPSNVAPPTVLAAASHEPSGKPTTAPHRAASPVPSPTERPPAVLPGGPRSMTVASNGNVHVVPHLHVHVPAANVRAPAIAMNVSCAACDYSGANLAGRNFRNQTWTGADFSGANLRGASFEHASLSGVDFSNADLRDASFVGADMQGCDLRGAQIGGADFRGASLAGCELDPSKLSTSQAVLLRACQGCDFQGADLHGRDLRGVELTGVDLSNADLRGADLSRASLTGVDLHGAKLGGARLDGTHFTGCDFRGVDLRNVDLSRADITGSSMRDAIFH
jgi:uncharacterized protein YjbI with pentapeptide repeats/beta-lactamase regulating signal transducer with metallopeptidase domain